MDSTKVYYLIDGNYYEVQQNNNKPPLKGIDSKSFGAAQAIGIGLIILGLAALTFISVVVLGGLAVPVSPIIFCIIAMAGAVSLFTGGLFLQSGDKDIQPKKIHQEPPAYVYTAQPQTYLYTTQ